MPATERLSSAAVLGLAILTGAVGAASAASEVAPVSAGIAAEAAPTLQGEGTLPEGPFRQSECVQCHERHNPALVAGWRNGPHGTTADCPACHDDRHGRLPAARHNDACTRCHGGAVEHSYASSKHGVITTLERDRWDWTASLKRGNYRAPGCAYCHLHAGDHGDTMDAVRGRHVRDWVCSGCHAPRYVADQFTAGAELLEIGRLKAEEAAGIAALHPEGAEALPELLNQVRKHLRNLRLGAGHQSPDYQWWHGQPALDGDLIRLRDAVAQAQRRSALRENPDTSLTGPGRYPKRDGPD